MSDLYDELATLRDKLHVAEEARERADAELAAMRACLEWCRRDFQRNHMEDCANRFHCDCKDKDACAFPGHDCTCGLDESRRVVANALAPVGAPAGGGLGAKEGQGPATSPERPWMCDACAGMGDDLGCMCGGSGLAVDAVDYLREQLFKRIATTSQGQASRLALRALDALSPDKKEPADG